MMLKSGSNNKESLMHKILTEIAAVGQSEQLILALVVRAGVVDAEPSLH